LSAIISPFKKAIHPTILPLGCQGVTNQAFLSRHGNSFELSLFSVVIAKAFWRGTHPNDIL